MNCTTALMKLPQGDLVRRKAWKDGEYLYSTFNTDEDKRQIQKINIKGEPTSEGKYITMEDMDADDWEVLHTTCKIGDIIFQRTIDHVNFSINDMVTIKTKINRKEYVETQLSSYDVRKLAKLLQDVIDTHKDLFTGDDIKDITWGDENE